MPRRPPPGVFIQTPVAEEEEQAAAAAAAAAEPACIPGNVSAAPRPPHSSASRFARAGREGGWGTRARGPGGRAPRGGRGTRGQEQGGGCWGARVEKEGARAGGRAGRSRRCLGAGKAGPRVWSRACARRRLWSPAAAGLPNQMVLRAAAHVPQVTFLYAPG